MRIFVTGASGLLGLNAVLQLRERHEVYGSYLAHHVKIPGMSRVDLTDAAAVERMFDATRPEMVLHTAGLTNVDACEANPAEARRQHVDVTGYVARAARAVGAKLVHISTDHLSDGTKAFAAEGDTPKPVNEYARTKWEAEQVAAHVCPDTLIIRTNFFGWGTPVKKSFSDWILDGLRSGRTLRLFTDVFVSPILMNDLVEVIENLAERKESGVFNVASRERISKYEFGLKVAEVFRCPPGARVEPANIGEASLIAPRPRDMSLGTFKTELCLKSRMPALDEGLHRLEQLESGHWPESIAEAMASATGGARA